MSCPCINLLILILLMMNSSDLLRFLTPASVSVLWMMNLMTSSLKCILFCSWNCVNISGMRKSEHILILSSMLNSPTLIFVILSRRIGFIDCSSL